MRPLCVLLLTAILFCGSAKSAKCQIVISEVYGGGGVAGAAYTNDFVELYNNGSTAVDLTGWTLQYATVSGSFAGNPFVSLSQSLDPGKIAIIVLAGNGGGATGVPTSGGSIQLAFLNNEINASASNGKFALVNNSTAVPNNFGSVTSGTGAYTNVVDFVGYGSPNQSEGDSPAPDLTATTSAVRKAGATSLIDTNNNANDFLAGSPTPGTVLVAVPEPGSLLLVGVSGLAAYTVHRVRRPSRSPAS